MIMKAKLVFAITAAKFARWLCRVLNKGGTALPGRIAVRLCPDILKQLGSQVNPLEGLLLTYKHFALPSACPV